MKLNPVMVNLIRTGLVLAGLLAAGASFAQPVITTQPGNVAVSLSSNATFRVTASGTAPLAYQWWFDGRPLANATLGKLVVSNITLADLGSYTVVVSDGSGSISSQPAWLRLARWTEMVVFGSSLCMASATNGRSWVEWLQELLGFPLDRIRNYARAGGQLLGVRSQIQAYLLRATPGTNTLLAPFFVAEQLLDHVAVERYVSNYVANISLLANAGGRTFILTTPAPLNWGSADQDLRVLDQDLSTQFDAAVQKLQTDFGLTVFRFDLHDLLMRIWDEPAAYGFTNLTDAANACSPACDPDRYMSWDGTHPTTAVHHWVSDRMFQALTSPLVLSLQVGSPVDALQLEWHGGSPPFRLQRCEDLTAGVWQASELTFETNSVVVSPGPVQFFRLLQLGQ